MDFTHNMKSFYLHFSILGSKEEKDHHLVLWTIESVECEF